MFRGVLDFFRINNNHRVAIITADGIIDNFFKRHKRLNISKVGGGGKRGGSVCLLVGVGAV